MYGSFATNMSPKTVRLFVGNLPPDTVESDLNKLLKKYATVLTVEIKRRINDVFAFVDLENLKLDLDTCLHELSWNKWKGQLLKVQLARESFLQRLARERLDNVLVKKENVSWEMQHDINYINKGPEPCNNTAVNTMQRSNQELHGTIDHTSTDCSESNSDVEIPMKGSLKMFRGTTEIQEKKKSHKIPNLNADKISTNKINEEKEILETFELFNDVWKDDEPFESAAKKTTNQYTKNRLQKQKMNVFWNSKLVEQGHESLHMNEDLNQSGLDMPTKISQIKRAEAEERRLKAIADRKKEILNKKQAVQYALASIDSYGDVNRFNKKIIFTTASEGVGEQYSSSREPKLTLFSENEMEQEADNKNYFRIRKHFEGEKGQSLLSLQARYGNDKRFILDERFIESDGEQREENKIGNDDTQAEREKVFRILGNVLGKEVPDTSKIKTKQTAKMMLRYDPSKPDHTKFEIKTESSSHKAKKMKTIKNDKVVKPKEEINILPVVSKERYYQVSETLRETLENKDQKFSLSAIFGEENASEVREDNDVNLEAKAIIDRKEWPLKQFQNDSSVSGDENEIDYENVPEDHCSEQNMGVRQECLFFEENDARFTEGLKFISFTNEEYINNFEKIRLHAKILIKHKVRNHEKSSERQRKKFGRKRKNSFPGKNLKTNFR